MIGAGRACVVWCERESVEIVTESERESDGTTPRRVARGRARL